MILKAWTEDEFRHEGKYWKYKDIAIWPRPYPAASAGVDAVHRLARKRSSAPASTISAPRSPIIARGVTRTSSPISPRSSRRTATSITPEHMCFFTDA